MSCLTDDMQTALFNLKQRGAAEKPKQKSNYYPILKSPLSPMGVLKKSKNQGGKNSEYKEARYEPALKGVVRSLLENTCSEEYPFIIAPPVVSKQTKGPVSMRKYVILCRVGYILTMVFRRTGANSPGPNKTVAALPRTIVVMLGGTCYSEVRSIYELRQSEQREIILGP